MRLDDLLLDQLAQRALVHGIIAKGVINAVSVPANIPIVLPSKVTRSRQLGTSQGS